MSIMPSDVPLGPLPEADRQDTLQQLSIKALRNCLPEEKFLFRDERIDDKGVDGALEVKVQASTPKPGGEAEERSLFTNFRAQAQLKSTDIPKRNQDGSVSCSIETSNLNYLLNGQSPLYFLWIAPDNEIRYAWARDEWRRLDGELPRWREQGTITLRFERVLTAQTVDEIHERILKEARLARRISEALARSASFERVVVSINPQTLASTDPQQVQELLLTSGMTIVSSGFGQQVLDLVRLLNPDAARDARIHLVCAYAQHTIGRYMAALASIAETTLQADHLSADDRQFLRSLKDACDYQTGHIDLGEYLRRQNEWAREKTGIAALEHRLDCLRYQQLTERDPERRAVLLADLRQVADEMLNAPEDAKVSKLQARILLLSADGDELVSNFIESLTLVRMREGMRFASVGKGTASTLRANRERWSAWEERARAVLEAALAEGHPLLIGDALTARLAVRLALLLQQRMDAIGTSASWNVQEDAVRALMADAEQAMQIYARAGNLQGEIRAKLLLADLFEMAGQEAAARALAEGVLPIAQAMSYANLESHAQEYVSGETMLRRFEALIAERRREDEDFSLAEATDTDLHRLAQSSVAAAELPIERIPIVEREWQSQRAISRERLDWCRHLQLLQNLQHERHPSTHYRTDPHRLCICEKHKYRSAIENPDWVGVIAAFKKTFCESCPDRSPKNGAGA